MHSTKEWIPVALFYPVGLIGLWFAVRNRERRRQAEKALRDSNALLNAVINGTDYAIFASDPQGISRVYSQGAERMLGHRAEEQIGTPVAQAAAKSMVPEEVETRIRKICEQYGRPPVGMEFLTLPLDTDGPFGIEWTWIHKNGTRIPVALSVSNLEDGSTVAIARDMTQIKALERMKNEFISTVSHELRTPLTSIRGALGLVAGGAMGALPEKASELVTIAYRNSERLVRIINDILDIEKIDSGKLSISLEPVDAKALMQQAIETHTAYGEKYDVGFVLKQAPDTLPVMADPDRLMQVFANLMSNAAKFSTPGSEVWLEASVLPATALFTVRDFGSGIPPAFRSHVFEKFAQAENTDARRYDGTGLGLSITKRLVEAMNGSIRFETEEGKGTTFFFELPLAREAFAEAPPESSGHSPRILVCEDDQDVAALLKIMLERAGYAVNVAYSLAQARALLAGHSYAALTLDLMLPDGSGVDFLRELRSDSRLQDLPVIVVSARAGEGHLELKGDAFGMIDWMIKPIDEGLLVGALRRAIHRAGSGKPRILHVEDDADLSHILGQALSESAEWVGATTLREAEARLRAERFDLVVLDLGLPDGSGLQLLERLHELAGRPVPVLILSASETSEDLRPRVDAVLVKSRMSEKHILNTILSLIHGQPEIAKEKT